MSEFDHWLPLHIGDYLSDTRELTTLQHGAYLLLIMHYWKRRELPDDDHALAQIAGLSFRQWKHIGDAVKAFFKPGNCQDEASSNCHHNVDQKRLGKRTLSHARLDRDIEKAKAVSEARKRAGSKGLRQRYAGNCQPQNLAIADTRARVPSPDEGLSVPKGQDNPSSDANAKRVVRFEGARALRSHPTPDDEGMHRLRAMAQDLNDHDT